MPCVIEVLHSVLVERFGDLGCYDIMLADDVILVRLIRRTPTTMFSLDYSITSFLPNTNGVGAYVVRLDYYTEKSELLAHIRVDGATLAVGGGNGSARVSRYDIGNARDMSKMLAALRRRMSRRAATLDPKDPRKATPGTYQFVRWATPKDVSWQSCG